MADHKEPFLTYKCVEGISTWVVATVIMSVGSFRIVDAPNMGDHPFAQYIISFYFIMFGAIMIANELETEFVRENFKFLQTNIGRGIFNIFCAFLFLAQEQEFVRICGGLLILTGLFYCGVGGRSAWEEQQAKKVQKEQQKKTGGLGGSALFGGLGGGAGIKPAATTSTTKTTTTTTTTTQNLDNASGNYVAIDKDDDDE